MGATNVSIKSKKGKRDKMYNKFIGEGRITHNLELKTTSSGVAVLTFTVAVERKYQNGKGERETDFIRCVSWRGNAEFITKYFAKGRMIHFDGELQCRKYIDKDGNTREVWEVVIERIDFTGEAKAKYGENGAGEPSMSTDYGQSAPDSDENYPFAS